MVIGERTTVVSVILDEETNNKLIEYKKRTGIPVSPLVRSLVRKWAEEEAKKNE